jgi:hypothetical protein
MFNFYQFPHIAPVILSPTTGEVVHQHPWS